MFLVLLGHLQVGGPARKNNWRHFRYDGTKAMVDRNSGTNDKSTSTARTGQGKLSRKCGIFEACRETVSRDINHRGAIQDGM